MKKMRLLVIVSLMLVAVIQSYTQQKSFKCGQWRWDIKTLTDKDGAGLLKAKPVVMNFDRFLDAKAPRTLNEKSSKDKTQPRFPSEKEVVEITAYITTITIAEDDHDLRVALENPVDHVRRLVRNLEIHAPVVAPGVRRLRIGGLFVRRPKHVFVGFSQCHIVCIAQSFSCLVT